MCGTNENILLLWHTAHPARVEMLRIDQLIHSNVFLQIQIGNVKTENFNTLLALFLL